MTSPDPAHGSLLVSEVNVSWLRGDTYKNFSSEQAEEKTQIWYLSEKNSGIDKIVRSLGKFTCVRNF